MEKRRKAVQKLKNISLTREPFKSLQMGDSCDSCEILSQEVRDLKAKLEGQTVILIEAAEMYNLFEEKMKEWEADDLESKKKIEENKQLVSRIGGLEEDLRISGGEIGRQAIENQRLQMANDEITVEMNRATSKGDSCDSCGTLSQEVRDLKAKVEEQAMDLTEAEEMYNLFEEQLKEWEADKLESKAKIEENKQLVSRIEKLEEDLRTSDTEIAQQINENQRLQARNAEITVEIESAKKHADFQKMYFENFHDFQSKINYLESRVTSSKETIGELEFKVEMLSEELQESKAETVKWKNANSEILLRNSQLKNEQLRRGDELEAKQKEFSNMLLEAEKAGALVKAEGEQEARRLEAILESQKKQIKELEESMKPTRQAESAWRIECEAANKRIEAMEKEMSNLNDYARCSQMAAGKAKQELEEANRKIAELQAKVASAL